MTCKGTCDKYKAKKPLGIGRYASGQVRCQICEIFMSWEGKWCPCCGYRLRRKPRNIVYKDKLKETEFKTGTEKKIFKDWRNNKNLEGIAELVSLLDMKVENGKNYQIWNVRFLKDKKKNPQCDTVKRTINIEQIS